MTKTRVVRYALAFRQEALQLVVGGRQGAAAASTHAHTLVMCRSDAVQPDHIPKLCGSKSSDYTA
jgi:hypothetical protein